MNHVLIGLGGTGGNVIRCFRRLICQEFRANEAPGINIGYLYVDSDGALMDANHQGWKVYGRSVQLPIASQLLIKGENLQGRLDNISAYPGIAQWIGDRSIWRDVLNSVIGDMLGGQKRRLGRFLLACRVTEFRSQLLNVIAGTIPEGASRDITFHVLCGLAGGTGGGTVVDVVSQIRDAYPDASTHRIVIYALLPEHNPNPKWEQQNYHSNGFAALTELNGLSVGAYLPWDLRGQKGRLNGKTTFNGCYLMTNENTNGIRVTVEHSVPQILADFLFQKIVVSRTTAWDDLLRMENAENGDGLPESPTGNPERSKRFLSFGIKRIAIPEEEITEYLSYIFARQCLRQLAANHWTDEHGFVDEVLPFDAASYVQQPACEARWCLTDEHLFQELPTLPNDDPQKRWRNFADDWREFGAHALAAIRATDYRAWLSEATRLFVKKFEADFRNVGVPAFFRARLQSRTELAFHVRQTVERELFREWTEGGRSMVQIRDIVVALGRRFKVRSEKIGGLTAGLQTALDNANAGLQRLEAEAARQGPFNRLFKQHEKNLSQYMLAVQGLYQIRTRIQAAEFVQQYLAALATNFEELQSDIDTCASLLRSAQEDVERFLGERIKDDAESDLKGSVVRYYSPAAVRSVARSLETIEERQRAQTTAARMKLLQRMGGGDNVRTFHLFRERITSEVLRDTIEEHSEVAAREAHDSEVERRKRVLGVPIIDKLFDDYGADRERLNQYIASLVKAAGRFLEFDGEEEARSGPGISGGRPSTSLAVFLPEAADRLDFRNALQQAFKQASTEHVAIIPTSERRNEITIVSIANLFPVRMAKLAKYLRERYQQRTSGPDRARALLELHTDDVALGLPPLYAPTLEEIIVEARPYLLLADAMGMVQEESNAESGQPECILRTVRADGRPRSYILGKVFRDAFDLISGETANVLKTEVRAKLESPDYIHAQRREQLRAPIHERLNKRLAEAGGDDRKPFYRSMDVAADVAFSAVASGRI
nr:tubulin-like doman-containing protein [uncultured Rhodopila sp.]